MNLLDFEGRGIKLKVTSRSDVKKFGTPGLLNRQTITNTPEVKVRVIIKVKVTSRSNISVSYCGRRRYPASKNNLV